MSIGSRFEEIQEILNKAQIVGGGNSDPGTWAGSKYENQEIPQTTDNGTDYKPKKKPSRRVKKSIDDFSVQELERELEVRKSGIPNPTMADAEIMNTVEGVSKAVCPSCGGNALHKGHYCGTCNNIGYVYSVETEEAASMIKSIQAKFNVDKIDEDFWKSQNKNIGGGSGDADTTPAEGSKGYRDSKEESGGEKVAKAMEEAAAELEDVGEDQAAMEEEEVMDVEKSVASLKKAQAEMLKGMAVQQRQIGALLKSMGILAEMNEAVASAQSDQGDSLVLIEGMIRKGGFKPEDEEEEGEDVEKSMNGRRGPARAPQARTSGLQVIQKSFSTSAPGSGVALQDGTPSGQQNQGPKYDYDTMRKAATFMAVNGDLDRRQAMAFDAGMAVDDKIVKSVTSFLDSKNGVVPEFDY